MEYIGLQAMEVVMKKERMSDALRAEACRMCHAGRASRKDRGYQKSMSGRAKYRGRTGPMTADTKKGKYDRTCGAVSRKDETYDRGHQKENMTGHAERHGRTERHGRIVDTKKENMSGRKHKQLQIRDKYAE
nr:hypothetical protein [Tanacetum cinerariifolium]